MSVNLTTMLVMTTIFISKMESLPPTSDIKMLDFWLIFCQIIPFAEVVILTAMEYQREDKNDVPLNPSCVNLLPICKDDIQTEPKTTYQKINLILFVPKLKTLGKFKVEPHHLKVHFSEKTLLPLLIFTAFVIYFGVAAYAVFVQP